MKEKDEKKDEEKEDLLCDDDISKQKGKMD